ncbi:hypothetical protein ACFX15_006629 [Malus domestica]
MNRSRTRVSAPKLIGGQNKTSVFKRLNTSVSRSSVFKRLSKPKKQSNTTRFPPRQSVMERLGEAKEPSKRRKTTPEVENIDRLAEKDNVRSFIPSRMKRQAILEVNTVGSLKVKRRSSTLDNLHANKLERSTPKKRPKTSSTSQSKKVKKMKSSRKMSLQHRHNSKMGGKPQLTISKNST